MRIAAASGLGLVLCVSGLALGQTGSGDEAAIRRIVQQYDEARSKSDWKTAASLFVEDGSNLTSSGEWQRTRSDRERRRGKHGWRVQGRQVHDEDRKRAPAGADRCAR